MSKFQEQITESVKLRVKHHKASERVVGLKKELSKLGEILTKKAKENELPQQESVKTKKELSPSQLYVQERCGAQVH